MSRRILWRAAGVLLVLPWLALSPAEAQFGSLGKKILGKKAEKQVEQKAGVAPAACSEEELIIDEALVGRYLASLRARDQEITALSKEGGETGRYYAAVLRRRELARREQAFQRNQGPDYERYKALYARGMQGDGAAMQEAMRIPPSLDPDQVPLPSLDWKTQRSADGRLEKAMAGGGEFTPCEWTQVVEVLPRAAALIVQNPEPRGDDLRLPYRQTPLSPAEVAALRGNRLALAEALGMDPRTEAEKRRDQEAAALAQQPPKSPYQACLEKELMATQKYFEANKDKLEKAQAAGDQATLMEFAQKQQEATMAAAQKCAQLTSGDEDE